MHAGAGRDVEKEEGMRDVVGIAFVGRMRRDEQLGGLKGDVGLSEGARGIDGKAGKKGETVNADKEVGGFGQLRVLAGTG